MSVSRKCRRSIQQKKNAEMFDVASKALLHLDAATVKVRAEKKRKENILLRKEEEVQKQAKDSEKATEKMKAEKSKIERKNRMMAFKQASSKMSSIKFKSNEGYLIKSCSRGRSFKKRWFVLEGSALSYYTSQPKADTNPKGTLGLKGAKLTEEPFANAEKKSLHYFQLITVDKGTSDVRVTHICAETQGEKNGVGRKHQI